MGRFYDDPMTDPDYDDDPEPEQAPPARYERAPLERRQLTAFVVGAALVAAVALGVGYRIGQANSPEAARILERIEQARAEVRVTDIPNTFTIHEASAARSEPVEPETSAPAVESAPARADEPSLTFYKELPAAPKAPAVAPREPAAARAGEPAAREARLESLAAARVAQSTPPAAAPTPAAAPSGAPDLFTVQVSSFQERGRADGLVEQLRAKSFAAYTMPSEVPGKGTWYRVRVGQFTTREAAEAVAAKLRSAQGMSAYVTVSGS